MKMTDFRHAKNHSDALRVIADAFELRPSDTHYQRCHVQIEYVVETVPISPDVLELFSKFELFSDGSHKDATPGEIAGIMHQYDILVSDITAILEYIPKYFPELKHKLMLGSDCDGDGLVIGIPINAMIDQVGDYIGRVYAMDREIIRAHKERLPLQRIIVDMHWL